MIWKSKRGLLKEIEKLESENTKAQLVITDLLMHKNDKQIVPLCPTCGYELYKVHLVDISKDLYEKAKNNNEPEYVVFCSFCGWMKKTYMKRFDRYKWNPVYRSKIRMMLGEEIVGC